MRMWSEGNPLELSLSHFFNTPLLLLYSLRKKGHMMKYKRFNEASQHCFDTLTCTRTNEHSLSLTYGSIFKVLLSPPEFYNAAVKGTKDKWSVKNCFPVQQEVTQSFS